MIEQNRMRVVVWAKWNFVLEVRDRCIGVGMLVEGIGAGQVRGLMDGRKLEKLRQLRGVVRVDVVGKDRMDVV